METPFGTDTGGVHPAMFDVKPEARFDSWLTFNQDDGENKDKIKYAPSSSAVTIYRSTSILRRFEAYLGLLVHVPTAPSRRSSH